MKIRRIIAIARKESLQVQPDDCATVAADADVYAWLRGQP
jgi:hypothetical protein